jgi:hypothetical protein
MVCNFEINIEQLHAALIAYEKAKCSGFVDTSLVFHISSVNNDGRDAKASFSNFVILKSNPSRNWGHCHVDQIELHKFDEALEVMEVRCDDPLKFLETRLQAE